MKRPLLAIAALALLATTALADYSLPTMPKKFQGTWIEAEPTQSAFAMPRSANYVAHANHANRNPQYSIT